MNITRAIQELEQKDLEILMLRKTLYKQEEEIMELKNRTCESCEDKFFCHTYKTLGEDTTYFLSCNSFIKEIK